MLTSYTFQIRQHSARPSSAVIITVNIFNNWYIALFIVLTVIPAEQFNRTHFRSSDNQL